jgi:trimethylguanosine synthase
MSSVKTSWSQEDVPPSLLKYYYNRYSLFSRFDEGIRIDTEGWYSVTPEKIAEWIAVRMPHSTIVDAFCGVGGNAIQFALHGKSVIAIDLDPVRLECAKNNAEVYGVGDKITFILGDFFQIASTIQADAIFLSPPWGGPEYLGLDTFDLDNHMPFSGTLLFETARKISENICYFLPRNIGVEKLSLLLRDQQICEVERMWLNDREKCVNVYFGDLVNR